ncbi:hypothetical protein Dsin_030267 [Dipteronia sinensis]|uniref:Protein FAR1-RELATED SEQUENCE n=1 Tax=Dipteronia sinensis TaxID=43782 RepID=A0AAD9ZJ14_9ROSI|nr:hypothetical protein Dsin_030267 [Dipteronia sinensis]
MDDMNNENGVQSEGLQEVLWGSSVDLYIPQVNPECKPKLGQEFASIDDVYEFYNQYANEAGFSIKVNSSRKNKTDEIVRKEYVCSKQGKSYVQEVVSEKKRHRGIVRENCYAKLAIVRTTTGTYKSANKHFGDVIVFDTTYNTNRYSMIFAPFVGVNNHGQTIIFACSLLSDETCDSFVWLLEQFNKVMSGGPPKMIITDQDPAITKAISQTLPNTFHRPELFHGSELFHECSELGGELDPRMRQRSATPSPFE